MLYIDAWKKRKQGYLYKITKS